MTAPVRLPRIDVGASGGRNRWSPPLATRPTDPTAAALECLREVLDPEIPVNVVDLGLIYALDVEEGVACVDVTFTATACPCMDFIKGDLRDRLLREPWIEEVELREVWDPPWTTERISDRGRSRLKGLGLGVG